MERSNLSRREFLKVSGAMGVGLLFPGLRGVEDWERRSVFSPETISFDIPEELSAYSSGLFDSWRSLAFQSGISFERLMDINGVAGEERVGVDDLIFLPRQIRSKYLLGREVLENGNYDLGGILRALVSRTPEMGQKEDFSDEEWRVFNVFSRWASKDLSNYLGDGPTAAGVIQIRRASFREVDESGNYEGGWFGWDGAAAQGKGAFRIKLTRRFDDPRFKQDGRSRDELVANYYSYQGLTILHEIAHGWLGGLDISPFDNHRLVYAIGDFGFNYYAEYSRLLGKESITIPAPCESSVEYFLVRQNQEIFRKLVPWLKLKKLRGQKPSTEEVLDKVRQIFPRYDEWFESYERPLEVDREEGEGKRLIYDRRGISEDISEARVTWYEPCLSVRYPDFRNSLERDYFFGGESQVINGFRVYLLWKMGERTKVGEVPKNQNSLAVGFWNPDSISATPTLPLSKKVAYWK